MIVMMLRNAMWLFFVLAVALQIRPWDAKGAPTPDEWKTYLKVKAQYEKAKGEERAKLEKGKAAAIQKEAEEKQKLDELLRVPDHLSLVRQLSSRPYLRRSYVDLLSVDSVNLGAVSAADQKILKDIKGGLINYSYDATTDNEVWNAEAALLWPVVFATGQTPYSNRWSLPYFGLMPSITLHRATTSLKPTNPVIAAKIKETEADELCYRLGLFAPIFTPWNFQIVERLNGAAKTDTHHGALQLALEEEMEPLWQSSVPWIGLGYLCVPEGLRKPEFDFNNPKTWRKTYLAYQARFRGRYLVGEIEDDGTGKSGPSFARAGFTAELNFDPILLERLTLTMSWTYMPTIHGPVDREQYLEAGLSFLIWENAANQQKVSLDATYKWGATDYLGKKKQDIYNVGISILY
jgi:hypothetical protein